MSFTGLITDKEKTYYVGNKVGKRLTYVEVDVKTVAVVDRNGELSFKTTIDGEESDDGIKLYAEDDKGFSRVKPCAFSLYVPMSYNGTRLGDKYRVEKDDDDSVYIALEDGHTAKIPEGTYAISIDYEYNTDDDDDDDYIFKYDILLDYAMPIGNGVFPSDEWEAFLNNRPERIVPDKNTAEKGIRILEDAFAQLKHLGIQVWVDMDSDGLFLAKKLDYDAYALGDEEPDDYPIQVPPNAFPGPTNCSIKILPEDDYIYLMKP